LESDDDNKVNREIKDGIFRLLFGNPENAAELYQALTDEECSSDEIQIITITTVVSGRKKNDLALVAKERALFVGEHMASPFANMPTRILMYTGQLYEKLIKMRGEQEFLYRSTLYKIPTPQFVVFYNGTANKPEKETLKLSKAYESVPDSDLGSLELEIPVYNINKGKNSELMKKSKKLRHYAEFIATLRDFQEVYDDYATAVRESVNYCIENDILADFLREQGGQIVSILTTEYDEEIARRVYGEEKMEEKTIEIVKNMLEEGFSLEIIQRLTGANESAIKECLSN